MDLYIFDFDRTLISTRRVLDLVLSVMPDTMRQECELLDAQGKTIDIVELAGRHGVDPLSLSAGLSQSAVYEDVKPWMDAHASDQSKRIVVMTSGGDAWQRMKLKSAGDAIPQRWIIIPEEVNKGEVLASQLKLDTQAIQWPHLFDDTEFRSLTVVDDKLSCLQPLAAMAAEYIRLYQILRPDGKEGPAVGPGPIRPITSLANIEV